LYVKSLWLKYALVKTCNTNEGHIHIIQDSSLLENLVNLGNKGTRGKLIKEIRKEKKMQA
jgi:hypothetical protein